MRFRSARRLTPGAALVNLSRRRRAREGARLATNPEDHGTTHGDVSDRTAKPISRIALAWSSLVSTLWFVPAILVVGAVAGAFLMVEASTRVDGESLARWPRLFGAGAEGSRGMLATIAGSMITVAGVTFSITVVAVTQASAQYSPRILRNFMRDRPSQLVLGGLAAIFAYCLVVLRTIRSGEDEVRFVPSLAVLLGFVLAGVGLGLLLYYIHHVASSLQPTSIIRRVTDDTLAAVDRLFPAEIGAPAREAAGDEVPPPGAPGARVVLARSTGYLQFVDAARLLDAACRDDLVVHVAHRVGDFVVEGMPLATVAARRGGADTDGPLHDAFEIGAFRTVDQDAEFGVVQLVDIALKALSPGVNDPTTALTCLDYLGAILVRAAARADEPAVRRVDGTVRVVAHGPTFERLLDRALHDIRRNARGQHAILEAILRVLDTVGGVTTDPARRALLAAHAELVLEAVERTVEAPGDRARLRTLADRVRAELAAPHRARTADGVASARRES